MRQFNFSYLLKPSLLSETYFRLRRRLSSYLCMNLSSTEEVLNLITTSYISSRCITVEDLYFRCKEFLRVDTSSNPPFVLSQSSTPTISGFGGAAATEILEYLVYLLCLSKNPLHILETGVAYGYSSLSILSSLDKYACAPFSLTSVDAPYRFQSFSKPSVGSAVPHDLRSNWTLHIASDRYCLPRLKRSGNKYSLIHYDSDKSENGRLSSYPILWEMLHQNGIFISDDVNDNPAFISFSMSINVSPLFLPVGGKYIGILFKK